MIFQIDTECVPFLRTKQQKGWFECWYAIEETRNALLDFVRTVIGQLYANALQNLPNCRSAAATVGTASGTTCHYCYMENEIVNHNLLTPKKWVNANKIKLCSSSWEFAKCFIHPKGYENKSSFEEVDLNALFSIIKNCKEFQTRLVSPILQSVENVSIFLLNY